MKVLDRPALHRLIELEVISFLNARAESLAEIKLSDVLRKKNPYLFRANNPVTVEQLVSSMLEARLSSSEEKKFGDLLERVVIFISAMVCDGKKSSATGIDLEFDHEGTRYLVAIKSGPNWGNSSQYQSLRENFRRAIKVQNQARGNLRIQAVLGTCYGSLPDVDTGLYLRKSGESFWRFVSGEANLHIEFITLIGDIVQSYSSEFNVAKQRVWGQLIEAFKTDFCFSDGEINWTKVVEFNSGSSKYYFGGLCA